MKNRPMNNGWYVSHADYMEEGTAAQIFMYTARSNTWTDYATGETVAITELPDDPQAMWPLRLMQR